MNRISQLFRRRSSVGKIGASQKLGPVNFPSHCRSSGLARLCLVAAFSLALLLGSTSAWAQRPSSKAKPVPKKTDTKPAPQPADDLKIDPETLPPGYKPPPERLLIMDLEKPLASKEELEKLNKESVGKFYKVKNDTDLSAAGKKVVQDSIRYKLWVMTLKDVPNRPAKEAPMPMVTQLPQLHKRFIEEIMNVGSPVTRAPDRAAFVEFMNKEIIKQIPDLLTNNFYVRLHAVMILGEMDYAGAYELLLQVLTAKDIKDDPILGQPEAVKIAAANGVMRILRFAKPPAEVNVRTKIAHALIDVLKDADSHWWLQVRLIECLRYCDISGADAADGRPFVVQALLRIMEDSKRPWVVRTKACHALGRVPLPGTKAEDIVARIAVFASALAKEAAADPKKLEWKTCFWDLYLTFKERDGKDMDAEGKNPGGLLHRAKSAAKPLYDLILPLVIDILHNKAPDPASRQKLDGFRPVPDGAANASVK